jgi:hypothetical protein
MKHTRESIIALINKCRAAHKHLDLKGEDLSGLDLQGIELRCADLREANLREANLQEVDLQGADLRGANLDVTGYELSCRTMGIKVDMRLVSQLLYHLCCMDVQDCPEWDKLRNDKRLIALANKSHVVSVHGLPGIKRIKAQDEK